MSIDMYLGESLAQADSAKAYCNQVVERLDALHDAIGRLGFDTKDELKGEAYDSVRYYIDAIIWPMIKSTIELTQKVSRAVVRFPTDFQMRVHTEDVKQSQLEQAIAQFDRSIEVWERHRQEVMARQIGPVNTVQIQYIDEQLTSMVEARRILVERLQKLFAFNVSSEHMFTDQSVEIQKTYLKVNMAYRLTTSSWNAEKGLFHVPEMSELTKEEREIVSPAYERKKRFPWSTLRPGFNKEEQKEWERIKHWNYVQMSQVYSWSTTLNTYAHKGIASAPATKRMAEILSEETDPKRFSYQDPVMQYVGNVYFANYDPVEKREANFWDKVKATIYLVSRIGAGYSSSIAFNNIAAQASVQAAKIKAVDIDSEVKLPEPQPFSTSASVEKSLQKWGYSVDEFKSLTDADAVLHQGTIAKVRQVRDDIGIPQPYTKMAKVIPEKFIDSYLNKDSEWYRDYIDGFASVREDSQSLKTMKEIYEGNALNYDGSEFRLHDKTYGKFEFDLTKNDLKKIEIPYENNVISSKASNPFTGRGFTGTDRMVLPEYKLFKKRNFRTGDVLSIYNSQTGEKVKQFIYIEKEWKLDFEGMMKK
ncbi:hypothetical protein [Abiotrophia defectiva]|uniref:hypothetical protein n=1 Tax=Abiotrophia defectiva TaxID=46125 RepID=UPI0028D8285E|nr:hypothetical protein [Abiotrophia defectiva]